MILADLSLARRLEAAEAAYGVACARTQGDIGPAVEQVAGGYAVFVGVNSMLTHALGLGMNGPVTAAEVDRLEAFFHGRGCPVNIDLCPHAHPTLVDILRRRGYGIAEFNTVMVRPLAGAPLSPPDSRVHECGPAEAEVWAGVVAAGFFERKEFTDDEAAVGRTIFHTPGSRCFLACAAGGEAAAGAGMFIQDGLASFFADATMTAFRRSGLHAALIRERLNAAIRESCDMATASTLPGSISQRNYERLGFQVVYTKVGLTR